MLYSTRVGFVFPFLVCLFNARVFALSSAWYTSNLSPSSLFKKYRSSLNASTTLRHLGHHQQRLCSQALEEQSSKLLSHLSSRFLFASAVFHDQTALTAFSQSVTDARFDLRARGCDTGTIDYDLHVRLHVLRDVQAMVYFELDAQNPLSSQRTILFPTCLVRKIGKRIVLKNTRRAEATMASQLSGDLNRIGDVSEYGSTSITMDLNGLIPVSLTLHLHCAKNRALSRAVTVAESISVQRVRNMLDSAEFNIGDGKGRKFMTAHFHADDEF